MKFFFAASLLISLAVLVVLIAESPAKGMAIGTAIVGFVFGMLLTAYMIVRAGMPQMDRLSELNNKLLTDKLEILDEYANETENEL